VSVRDLDPLEIAQGVLAREAGGLAAVAAGLGESFREAVALIESSRGRLVVTGVGKSGLVGAKIAATLTSTGTSAYFLHPTEAVHGDLGIVRAEDMVLALSRTGRSVELLQLLPHFERLDTPLLAIVQDAHSPLAEHARVVVELGPMEEACSLGVVPTTSAVAMMAVGDALAVALLRRRGLTREDFAFVHPGGVIGRQVGRRVRDLMHGGAAFPSVPDTATLRDALVEIMEKGLGIVTVLDASGALAGVLTDGDLKRILLGGEGEGVLEEPVVRSMNRSPRTIAPDALVAAAVRLMEAPRPGAVTSLIVVEGDHPFGVIHLHDCLRAETPDPAR